MNTPSFITPMSLLVGSVKAALRAWQDKGRARRIVAVIILTWLATYLTVKGQDFHYETNIVKVPCKMFYYYGVCTNGSVCFLCTVADHELNAFDAALHTQPCAYETVFRTGSPLDGVATVRHEGSATRLSAGDRPRPLRSPEVMPPFPVLSLPVPQMRKSAVAPSAAILPMMLPLVLPQTWTEQPFSYTAVTGQDDGFDNVMLMRTGWQIWFQFLQQSNLCYRICSSNETGWHPLSAICQQLQESTNTFHVPVVNLPIDWQPVWDAGTWSGLTNLVTTADGISYKLEAQN